MKRKMIFIILMQMIFLSVSVSVFAQNRTINVSTVDEDDSKCSFFAVKNDGTLWAWGENEEYQLGDGTTENKDTPIKILDDVVSVDYGYAVKKDNSLWSWGKSDFAGGSIYFSPTKVADDVTDVNRYNNSYADYTTTMITKKDRRTYEIGQMIDKDESKRSDKPECIGNNTIKAITGESHGLILKTDGSLIAMGLNRHGDIGNGETEGNKVLKQTKVFYNVKNIFAGETTSFAINNNDDLYLWGSMYGDIIGAGDYKIKTVPTFYINKVKAVVSMYNLNLILKTDGTMWAYGEPDEKGTIDIRKDHSIDVPQKIASDVNYIVGANDTIKFDTLVLKNNGELYHFYINDTKGNASAEQYKLTKVMEDVRLVDEATTSKAKDFTDISGLTEEAVTSVKALSKAEIMDGTSETEFSPQKSVTRAEAAAMLLRISGHGSETANEAAEFSDVTSDAWYANTAELSKKYGIVKGYEDNTFRGEDKVTATQFISLAARTLKDNAIDADPISSADEASVSDKIPAWAKSDIAAAEKGGLISDEFAGKIYAEEITRADAAVILYRLYGKI